MKIKMTWREFEKLPHVPVVKMYNPIDSEWVLCTLGTKTNQFGHTYPVAEWAEIEIVSEEGEEGGGEGEDEQI